MDMNYRKKLYKNVIDTLAEQGKKPAAMDRELGHCLIHTADEPLVENVIALFKRYPALGFRSIKAGNYVFKEWVWINDLLAGTTNDGMFAEVTGTEGESHLVGVTENGVYFCGCKDFLYRLKAIPVMAGPPQQPCCHILAVALSDPENMLRKFLPVDEIEIVF